jgi:hypothetical protein
MSAESTPQIEGALSSEHWKLLQEAGISREVADARPYRSLTNELRAALASEWGFNKQQLKGSGLVIARYHPDGREAPPQVRHDTPRIGKDGKQTKYDSPADTGGVVDVHPFNIERVQDTNMPLWIAESVKGGDALTTWERAAIAFQGVFGWSVGGKPSHDFEAITFGGRKVIFAFDSDTRDRSKDGPSSPREGLIRLAKFLELRGAEIYVAALPDGPDGKLGIDDWLGRRPTEEF